MALPEDDRRAVAARLATTAPETVDRIAEAVDDDEELRELLVDAEGDVVALTARRALLLSGGELRPFAYGQIDVRRREGGLGIDARVEGDRLVLDVARSTFVRLGAVSEGNPPGRATWLPVRSPRTPPVPATTAAGEPVAGTGAAPAGAVAQPSTPVPPVPPVPAEQQARPLPPPGWHPDPSGRHWWRWWDGRSWTEHVADGGAPFIDPLPRR